jgi:flagellar M-ring protein FliF
MNSVAIKDMWRNLEPRGQMTLVGSGLVVVVTLALLFMFASRPSYTTLASGIEASDSSEMTKALESAGVGYELRGGGTEIAVKDADASKARVALAEKGLPRSGSQAGWELFDKGNLGASNFQQQVNYQRALEGEIARTIGQIDGIDSVQVQLVLPEDSLFQEEAQKASAAVLLSGPALEGTTVRGIAHLVASSVKGLNADNVTITDASGGLLWPTGDTVAGGAGAGSRLAAEQTYASQLSAQINAMLTSTLGPDKALARVRANLDLDAKTIDKVTYAKTGTPMETKTEQETLKSKGTPPASAAGTGTNVPTYAAASGANGNSDYLHKTESTSFGVDKTVERTVVAPGAVSRIDVALMLDKSIPAPQVEELKASVASLAGVDTKRGDTLAVSSVTFAKAKEEAAKAEAAPGPLSNPLGLAKYVGLGLGIAIFLFLMRRNLKKRESEASIAEPTWLREIQRNVPIAQLESGNGNGHVRNGRGGLHEQVEELAETQPRQVAAQVGAWLKD